LFISGASPDEQLVEMIELRDHPYFVACQFHPEFKSRPQQPHPLFRSFVGAAMQARADKRRHSAQTAADPSPPALA
jgi:CTP synthase